MTQKEQIKKLEERIEKLEKQLIYPVIPLVPGGIGTYKTPLDPRCLHNGCKEGEPCDLYCPHCSPIC